MSEDTSSGRREVAGGRSIRWNPVAAELAYASGSWVTETLADVMLRKAEADPDRVALVDGDLRIDYRCLRAAALALAGELTRRFEPGGVVSFMLPNWHEATVIYLAATLSGLVVNPILPSLGERELRFIIEDARSRIIFVPAAFRQRDYVAMLSSVCGELECPPEVVVLRGDPGPFAAYDSFASPGGEPVTRPVLDADSVRMVLFTSGTTGRAKGVLHTHNSIHALIRQIAANWLFEPGDTLLVPSPVGHITGSMCANECTVMLDTTTVLMDQWDSDLAIELIEEFGVTHMTAATPFLEQLLVSARAAGTRLPSLKFFACGGASVPPALIREAASYFERAAVTRVYGSTEVPLICVGVSDRKAVDYAAETDGRAHLAEVKLAPHPAAPEGEGEVLARGPQMLVGYLDPRDELDAFDADGFFRTGDIARWIDDDYLVVTGRAKDIIIRNGENISPKEIEDLLIRHPDIEDVAVIGLPDARTGERACAVIVAKDPHELEVRTVAAYLGGLGIAKFKFPERIEFREALPRNAAGKVLKHELRASLIPADD